MSIALDKQHVIDDSKPGKKESVHALDPRWMEDIRFVAYQAPPTDLTDRGQFEEWCERLKFIEDDLHTLLQLPHNKFWCQAIFDETLHKLVDSYLRFAPRSFAVIQELPEEIKDRHNEIHRLVFMTCVRMSTYRESKECHLTPSVFGEILYENFLFDIPKILDLCALYGRGNGQLLTKMIENIFNQQSKYQDDLVDTINTMAQVFDKILQQCGIALDHGSLSPQRITDPTAHKTSRLVAMETREFKDVLVYMEDIGSTLTIFLEVYPAACKAFHENGFLIRLPAVYDAIIPEMFTALKQRDFDRTEKKVLKQRLIKTQRNFLSLFQLILYACCIQPILDKKEPVIDFVEDYLHILSSILGERRFLADFEGIYSFQGDLDILSQASCGVDEMRLQYIQEAVNSAFSTFGKRKTPKGATNRGGRKSPDGSPGPLDDGGAVGGVSASGGAMGGAMGGASIGIDSQSDVYQVEDLDLAGEGACARTVSGVELESLITSVKDLLPDLGEGFIELCLEELNYDLEKVINALLEEKLPPSLQDIDRQMRRQIKEPPPETLVSQRKNVYDFDEFDVFNRDDINTDKIHKGKTSKSDTVKLGDKSVLKGIKDNISKDYGVVIDVVEDDGTGEYAKDVYDDEYDDTYDTNVVGADDADSADELTFGRPFTRPRVLGGNQKAPSKGRQSSGSEEEETDDQRIERERKNFIEDPAQIRARAEDRAKWKANRTKGGHQPRSYDVKGGPKGQGQSDEVSRNRRWKTQHKGEHRRAQAERKRKV